MKKIIAITAMVAAAAGIAMAAEVSAGVRLTTDFFGYDKTTGVTAFTIKHDNQFYHAPIAFSVSGEKAGGTLKLTDKDGDKAITGKWNVWFAPIDPLKVNVGVWTNTLNQESIGWYRSQSGIGKDDNANFAVTLSPAEGFAFDAVVATGFGSAWFQDKKKVADGKLKGAKTWAKTASATYFDAEHVNALSGFAGDDDALDKAWNALSADQKTIITDAYAKAIDDYIDAHDTDAAIDQLGFMAKYSADFGTVGAMFKGESNFKNLTFGGSFAGSFDPLSFFVNVLGSTAAKYDDPDKTAFNKIRVEAFASTTVDALSAKLWVPFEFITNCDSDTKAKDKINLGALLRLDYTVGDYTLFLETGADDFLADTNNYFNLGIKPGVKFNVGECAIEAAIDVHATKYFSFSVPVSFQVAF